MRGGAAKGARQRITGALAVVLVVALLGGCGGSGPSATATSPPIGTSGTPLVATAAVPAVTPTATLTPVASPAAASLRDVDWRAVLTDDPQLDVEPPPPGFPPELGDIYVSDGPDGVYGFPGLGDILFGDLDGDGGEEAVIPLNSGGTAGTVGVLVYRAGEGGPRLTAARPSYKLAARLDGDELVLLEAAYAGWEPNCCPSAWVETRYRLAGDALVPTTEQVEPVQGTELLATERFYTLLSDGRYEEAYDFLSPAFQAEHPYDAWLAGYAHTEAVTAYVAQSEPGRVTVNLEARERDADGAEVVRRFSGTWDLVFSPERRQWLLDRAAIREVE